MPVPIPGRVAEALRRSTVQVRGVGRGRGFGSGVMLNQGRIVTNAHVLTTRSVDVESWEGKTVRSTVLQIDRHRDLALLAAPGLHVPELPLADSDLLRAGTPVIAIGSPFGFIGAASSGVVCSVGGTWIQADVRLAPGNSGGPLANLRGEVVGINSMVMRGGLALAIPSRAVQAFLSTPKAGRALGVTLRQVRLNDREIGLLLLEVEKASAAERASLLAGDILLAVNGRSLRSADDLQMAVHTASDAILRLQFYRGGQRNRREVVVNMAAAQVPNAA